LLLVEMVASAFLAGCSGGDELRREAVSGTVSFKGAPLKKGMIQFQPTSGNETTAGAAGIVDGKYSIDRDEGLVPGKYQVMITGILGPSDGAKAPKAAMPGDVLPVLPAKELIPAKYNVKTELTAQVASGGANEFNFDLKEK